MYAVESFVDTDIFDAYNETFRRAPGFMAVQTNRLISRRKSRLKSEILVEPPLPDLPFVWSTDPVKNARARGWYFANRVPEGSQGGRYQRTGALLDGFDILVNVDERGGIFTITNDVPGAEFVIGFKQVPSHRKWIVIDDVAIKFSELLNEDFIQLWHTVNDPFAGVQLS